MADKTKIFGSRLRSARKAQNLKQFELAKILKISGAALSYYESNTHKPDLNVFYLICKKLKVTPNYLLGLSDN